MYMVNPILMCDQNLRGEHYEFHKHRHIFVRHYRIDGRISPIVQIEPESMQARHDELVEEMLRRGMKHNSPYVQPDLSYLPDWQRYAKVDLAYNLRDLAGRCAACRERITRYINM